MSLTEHEQHKACGLSALEQYEKLAGHCDPLSCLLADLIHAAGLEAAKRSMEIAIGLYLEEKDL